MLNCWPQLKSSSKPEICMKPEFIKNDYADAVRAALSGAEQANVISRIWKRDASLWKSDPDQKKGIENSLGWLTVAGEMLGVVDELKEFAQTIRDAGYKQVMVCGMGGSSLCPEVLAKTFGPQAGYPELRVLDSTDPDAIATLAGQLDLEHCLFVISSKSGTTTEPLCFYKYWYEEVSKRKRNPGESFVLITDPATPLIDEARTKNFRRIFLNQPDIGGRYSALSYFGMVPAALMGLDLATFLKRAHAMSDGCGPQVPPADNPGALLGGMIAECARAGRDKLTLVTGTEIATLGLWIEQLVAESTGKEGKGILPVDGELLSGPESYGTDRLFVAIAAKELSPEVKSKLERLESAGNPVVYRSLSDEHDLAGEFFVWEFATAFAAWRLKINPFDQPNVQESKDATKRLLQLFAAKGSLPEQTVLVSDDVLTIYADKRMRFALASDSTLNALRAHVSSARPGDYFALLNYVEETPAIDSALQSIRTRLRDSTRCATTTGYGPRFLHSTGQLHKGGPDTGVFLQITAVDKTELAIPGEPYGFSVLKQAQALGDFEALSARSRRAIRVELGPDVIRGLTRLEDLLVEVLS